MMRIDAYELLMENIDRIAKLFSTCKEKERPAFVGYVCACDPNFDTSLLICKSLIENGVDILELGVPFSDPLADGLTNQLAAQRALESGCCQDDVFRLVKEIRKFSQIPIVFYTYYNLVFSQGIEEYVNRSVAAGVDGLLTLDLPPEEADELVSCCREKGLKNIFIVAPTTPIDRIPKIIESTSGFIYYVSRAGVTGEQKELASDLEVRVANIKKYTDLPVVVGFGISNSEQASAVGKIADGVVIGSTLVNCISGNLEDPTAIVQKIGERAQNLSSGL